MFLSIIWEQKVTDERKRFAAAEHEYLVNTVQKVEDTITPSISGNGDTSVIDLNIQLIKLTWLQIS